MLYAKAITAFVTPIILSILVPFGINGETPVMEAIDILVVTLITTLAVYFVPNRKV
jgi:hypothetical protein